MRYRLHPGAAEDLREAASFYRERAGNLLAQSFFSAFEHSVEVLLRHPGLGAAWRYGNRRMPMSRFPYSLIYLIEGEEIRVVAVAHQSRRPGYWRARRWPE
jgi:plasmid stabilization system protein ParE